MTSVAMMVLNISDRPYVSWLPFSALQVAAVPVVVGDACRGPLSWREHQGPPL